MYPNTITIVKNANGWTITIPLQHDTGTPIFGGITEDQIRKFTRVANDEIHGDDLLKNIQDQEDKKHEFYIEPAKNVFIFREFDAVLEFLDKNQYNF